MQKSWNIPFPEIWPEVVGHSVQYQISDFQLQERNKKLKTRNSLEQYKESRGISLLRKVYDEIFVQAKKISKGFPWKKRIFRKGVQDFNAVISPSGRKNITHISLSTNQNFKLQQLLNTKGRIITKRRLDFWSEAKAWFDIVPFFSLQ